MRQLLKATLVALVATLALALPAGPAIGREAEPPSGEEPTSIAEAGQAMPGETAETADEDEHDWSGADSLVPQAQETDLAAFAVLDDAGTLTFVRTSSSTQEGPDQTVIDADGNAHTGTVFRVYENADFGSWPWDSYRTSIRNVTFAQKIRPASTYNWFRDCTNLVGFDGTNLDTSGTKMDSMFFGCSSLAELDVSSWDTSSVRNMGFMFYGCSSLAALDVSGWDTSSVGNMDFMFYGCSSLAALDVSGWDTSSVGGMGSMFSGCSSLAALDVSGWDTSRVDNMGGMFFNCKSLASLDLSSWDTSEVTNMGFMFDGCSSLERIKVGSRYAIKGADMFPQGAASSRGWWSMADFRLYTRNEIARSRSGVADTYLASRYSDVVAPVEMHRLYNPNSGEHFYTGSAVERDAAVAAGWRYEGVGWLAPATSSTPVYRLYNANAGDHHYTMSEAERDALVGYGWRNEGVGWYSDDGEGVALLREYNPNAVTGSHNYTADRVEHEALVRLGWHDEGVGWYGLGAG